MQISDETISQLTLTEKLIIDEETGLRGYQTTGDPEFLSPYTSAKPQVDPALQRLEDSVALNPTQIPRVRDLRQTHSAWLQGFAEPLVSTIQAGGTTTDIGLNLQGKSRMDDIRHRIESIRVGAEQKRQERLDNWRAQTRVTVLALIFLTIAIGLGIGLFVRKQLRTVSISYQRALDHLRRYADDIYASEQRLRITLSSIGDGVIVCSVDGKVEMLNLIAEELTGWSNAEARNVPLEQVFRIVNESTRLPVENPVAKVKRLNRVVGLANHTVLIRKNGDERNIDDSGAPIRDQDGTLVGIVLVFRDITLQYKTQAALLANEKLAVAGRLAATIAHEIHNPLDSVANLLFLMQSGATPQESAQFLEMAQQELSRTTQISRAMLSLYREAKSPIAVNLHELIDSLLLLMRPRLSEIGVTTTIDVPTDLTVDAFPAELRQVFTNLITNAAEAAGKNGRVSITGKASMTRMGESGAILEVKDNGPGIPADVQARLFEPFFSTKGEKGTGLGLWVSRGIIQKHGGTIRIESNTDAATHGTSLIVSLPPRPSPSEAGD